MSSYDLIPRAKGKPLTGRNVLAILLTFFGIVASVNAVMIYFALSTFRGETEPHPYERGLAYNRDIAEAREQTARDWKVEASIARDASGNARVLVIARDASGAAASGLNVKATLAAPADKKKDARVSLGETAPGRYEGNVALAPGWRDLVLVAEQDGKETFRSKNRLRIE